MQNPGTFRIASLVPPGVASRKARNAALFGAVLAGSAALTGCTSQSAPTYSWSHAASGEYLFAFDTRECGEVADASVSVKPGDSPTASREFFACMVDRGYFLIDPATGRPLVGGLADGLPGINEPQAAR